MSMLRAGGLGDPSVCIAIPCVPAHWQMLPRALRSVKRQSKQPDKVVVVLSHASTTSCGALQTTLRAVHATVTLLCTRQRNKTFTRGANRNLARDACSDMTYVSFIDADDEMSPTCVERMLVIMREHSADLGLHSYSDVPKGAQRWNISYESQRRMVTSPDELRRKHQRAARSGAVLKMKTHFGHSFARTTLLRAVPQPEDLKIGEDAEWTRRVFARGYRVVHTNEVLSYYHLGTSVFFEHQLAVFAEDDDTQRQRWRARWGHRSASERKFLQGPRALPLGVPGSVTDCIAWSDAKRGVDLKLQETNLSVVQRCMQRYQTLASAQAACEFHRVWCRGVVRDRGLVCASGERLPFELRGNATSSKRRMTYPISSWTWQSTAPPKANQSCSRVRPNVSPSRGRAVVGAGMIFAEGFGAMIVSFCIILCCIHGQDSDR